MLWADFQRVRRSAACDTASWDARGKCIYDDMEILIAQVRDPETATRIVEQHNGFLPVCNLVIMAVKKWSDARDQNREYEAEREAIVQGSNLGRRLPSRAANTGVGHRKH